MLEIFPPVEGRVAVITGAARGLGRAHALAFAKAGAKVLVNDLGVQRDGSPEESQKDSEPSPAEAVVQEIRDLGGTAEANFADVADWDQADAMIKQAIDLWGRLDTLVLNAGFLRDRMLVSMSEEEFDAVVRVHLKGHFVPARHAVQYWRDEHKAGNPPIARIINTSSGAGLMGSIGQGNYAAAKAGIALLTIQQAAEWERYGVLVNAIAPDARTRMTEGVFYSADDLQEGKFDAKDPANASPLVVWLGSEECDITGRVFEITGGILNLCDGWQHSHKVDVGERSFTLDEMKSAVHKCVSNSPAPAPVYGIQE